MTTTLQDREAARPAASRGPRPGPPRRRPSKARRRSRWTVLLFMSPWIIGGSVFIVYPLLAIIYYSFTNFDLINNPTWAGLGNYVYMFTKDPLFWTSAWNTAWLTVVITITQVAFGLGVALILVRIKRGAGVFRTLFYLPSLTPPVAAVLAFVFLLNPGTGPVNKVLAFFGIPGPLWFNDPALAKPSLAAISLWMSGTIMVIMLAGLLDVPGELYEAAQLDGAGRLAQFRHVTLPALAPVLTFCVVNSLIGGLQYFTQAMVAGQTASAGSSTPMGYPDNSTLTYPMWLFNQAFQQFHMGYASAMSVVLFVVSALFTVLLVRQMRVGGEED